MHIKSQEPAQVPRICVVTTVWWEPRVPTVRGQLWCRRDEWLLQSGGGCVPTVRVSSAAWEVWLAGATYTNCQRWLEMRGTYAATVGRQERNTL